VSASLLRLGGVEPSTVSRTWTQEQLGTLLTEIVTPG
jgi:hypothetical protein